MFSALGISIKQLEERLESERLKQLSDPWEGEDATNSARNQRIKRAIADFWYFDKTYFTADLYSDGYSAPAPFHRFLASLWNVAGVHIILAPRKHGKTAMFKKLMVWLLVTGRLKLGATLSSTLMTSKNILEDISKLLRLPKIAYDWGVDIVEDNAEQITFRLQRLRGLRRVLALSEKRSARGVTMGLQRLEFVFCDDLETRQSGLSAELVQHRIKVIKEVHQSLSSRGSLCIAGNNFSPDCALNLLLQDYRAGLLPKHWQVYVFPAWIDGRPLWRERFPACSEEELKQMLNVTDFEEWQGEFMQNPLYSTGFLFKPQIDNIAEEVPEDARGVVYCDPNLALKHKGDKTCIIKLLYSPSTHYYYIDDLILRSFDNSNDLLINVLRFKDGKVRVVGMDGSVNQQSNWANHIRNFAQLHNYPYPPIQFCRYKTDELSKNASLLWNDKRILVNRSLINTNDYNEFLKQLYSFVGKKANNPDDGVDALICAIELLHERNLVRKNGNGRYLNITMLDETIF